MWMLIDGPIFMTSSKSSYFSKVPSPSITTLGTEVSTLWLLGGHNSLQRTKQIFKIWKCLKLKLESECRLMFLNFPTLQEMDFLSPGHFGNPGPPFLPSQGHVTAECSAFLLHVFFVILQIPGGAELGRLLSSRQYVSLLYGILVKF